MKKFSHFIDSFDVPFTFLFNGSKKFYTPFGISFSLIIIIICSIYGIILFIELISHNNPSLNYEKITSSSKYNMTFNDDILFTIAFRNSNYKIINDPTIGYIEGTYEKMVSVNGTLKQTTTKLIFFNCSNLYDKFEKLEQGNRFKSLGLSNYSCFKNANNDPIILGGVYGTDFYGNLAFYIKKCVNDSSSNIICKDEETIEKNIQNGWLQISYLSAYIDYYNYSNPIQYKALGTYSQIDVNVNKIIYSYFNPVFIYTDSNVLFPMKTIKKSFKEEIIIRDINVFTQNGIVFTIYLCPSDTVEKYKRSYIKIHNIGSYVAGVYFILHSLFSFFYSYFQNKLIETVLANNLFTFASHCSIGKKYSLFSLKKNRKNYINLNKVNNKKKLTEINKNTFNNSFLILNKINSELNKSNMHRTLSCSLLNISNKLVTYKNENEKLKKINKLKYYNFSINFIKATKMVFLPFLKSSKEYIKENKFIKNNLNKLIDYKIINKKFVTIDIIKKVVLQNEKNLEIDKNLLFLTKIFNKVT